MKLAAKEPNIAEITRHERATPCMRTQRERLGTQILAWSRPRWAGKHRFCVTCVLGPLKRQNNVQNDRTLGPAARYIQNKQNIAGYDRHWPTASLQSAQSAASTRHTVRGGQLSRPSARPQGAPAMPHGHHTFRLDVDQRLAACVRLRSPDSCLFAFFHPTANGGLAAPARGCMVHASAGDFDDVRPHMAGTDHI